MKRNEIDELIKSKVTNLTDNWYLSKETRLEYFQRLIKPYTKKGETKYFIMQYLDGDGNELNKKFWSIHSSSRFAFELYSWMANDSRITDFSFEKKLMGLNEAKKGPNMDVYIEKTNEAFFIESKFTEKTSPTIDNLSEAYYLKTSEATNKRGLIGKLDLEERYY